MSTTTAPTVSDFDAFTAARRAGRFGYSNTHGGFVIVHRSAEHGRPERSFSVTFTPEGAFVVAVSGRQVGEGTEDITVDHDFAAFMNRLFDQPTPPARLGTLGPLVP